MPTMKDGGNRPGGMMIGELARRSGFTIRTIRFYERRGLLRPAARRASGYRIYKETELGRLTFIRQAKALGLTLADIRPLVASFGQHNGTSTRERLARVLGERIQQTTDQLKALTDLREELRRRRLSLLRRAPRRGDGHSCTCLEKTTFNR